MNKELPLYQALITDEFDGIQAISLVSSPAIEIGWQCFSKQEQMYSIKNADEHLLSGVVMLCGVPIYRRDETGYEYNIVYTAETIKLMAQKMLSDNSHNQIDIEHNNQILEAGKVNLVELYIVDKEKGLDPKFVDVPDGSLMATYKVNDDVLWSACKEGRLTGFSLAGIFDVKEFKDKKKSKYSMIEKIKEKLRELLVELSAEEETTESVEETETPAESTEETTETVEDVETPPESTEETTETVENVAEETTETPTETEVQMAAETKEDNKEDTEEVPADDEVPDDDETKEEVPEEKEDNSELALIKADIVSMKNDIELAKGLYEQMKTDLESIKETLQNLVNAPVVPPVTEQFEAATVIDKKVSKAAKYAAALHK